MGLFWSAVNGAAKKATGRAVGEAQAYGVGLLQSKLAGGFSKGGVQFYYMSGPGGKVVDVLARKAAGIAASMAKDAVDGLIHKGADALRKVINGGKVSTNFTGDSWVSAASLQAQDEINSYGVLHDVNAYDDYGNVCYEAVMLAIPVSSSITHTALSYAGRKVGDGAQGRSGSVTNSFLVWYDTVGLVSVNSDKNVVLTQVAGRDYSRKELVSNGDIRFSVSGHITSNLPDCYPRQEVQKFREIMRYRGIVEVNNEIFDQWGIKYIVITSFNLPPTEGMKSVQDYSFECVGIQPEQEADVREDTVLVHDFDRSNPTAKGEGTWIDLLKNAATGAVSAAEDIATQGTAVATGLLNNL